MSNFDQAMERYFQNKLERDEARATRWEKLRQEKHEELKKLFLEGLEKLPEKTELPFLMWRGDVDCLHEGHVISTWPIKDAILDMLNDDKLLAWLMEALKSACRGDNATWANINIAILGNRLADKYASDHAGDLASFEIEGEQ